MPLPKLLCILVLLTSFGSLSAQTPDPLSPVSLPAQLPPNWKMAGTVQMAPTGSTVRTTSGNSLLTGSAGQPLVLRLSDTDDVRVRMDVMLSPDGEAIIQAGNAQIALQSGAAVGTRPTGTLTDASNRTVLPASQSVGKAPGLWQTLELAVSRNSDGRHTRVEQVRLNGVLLHENQVLPGAAPPGQVSIQVPRGTAAVRRLSYQLLSGQPVVRPGAVRYKLFEGETGSAKELTGKKLLTEGTAPAISHEVAYGQTKRYAILFDGDFDVLKADNLTFSLNYGGMAGLSIDGKEVIPAAYATLGQPVSAQVALTPGKHTMQVFYGRSWPRPGLGVFVSGTGTRPQALHTTASLPEPDPVGAITVGASDKPVMIRSFVQLPDERRKRTHVLSVGSPSGMHYSIDLNQGALLQVWKGDFADVTEMWHERGEPQLLQPLGSVVILPPKNALGLLANPTQYWPDSLNENEFRYLGLKIDSQGHPIGQYSYRDMGITDRIVPTGSALVRTITVTGPPSDVLYARLAGGSAIEEVAKGLYAINDRSYYVRIDSGKPTVRTSGMQKELLMPVGQKGGSTVIQYEIIW